MGLTKQFLWDFLRRNVGGLTVDALFLLAIPVNEILLPHLYGKIVSAIQKKSNFLRLISIAVGIILLVKLASNLHDLHNARFEPRLEAYIRERLVQQVLENHRGQHKEIPVGDLITYAARAPRVTMNWFTRIKDYILPYTFTFGVQALYFFRQDALLGLTLAVVMAVILLLLGAAPRTCSRSALQRDEIGSKVYRLIEELVNHMVPIFTSDKQQQELQGLRELEDQHVRANVKNVNCIVRLKMAALPILAVFLVTFVLRCTLLLRRGALQTAAFVSMFTMILTMTGTLNWLVDIMQDVVNDSSFLHYMNMDLQPPDRKGAGSSRANPAGSTPINSAGSCPVQGAASDAPSDAPSAALQVTRICIDLDGRPVLRDVTFQVAKGEQVAVVGEIGSGKSTLLRVLAGLLTPSSGCIYLHGRLMGPDEAGVAVSYVPQSAVLFNRTLYENLVYGNDVTRPELEAFLDSYGVLKEMNHFPLDDSVGKNGTRLSGGQRQLVWCVRAVMGRADVLLLDEPTASMSASAKQLLMRMLNASGKTAVIVTHDGVMKKFCTRNIQMQDGTGRHMFTTLVLGASILNATVYIGAYRYLYERGYHKSIRNIHGTSSGSMLGFMVALGLTPDQMRSVVVEETARLTVPRLNASRVMQIWRLKGFLSEDFRRRIMRGALRIAFPDMEDIDFQTLAKVTGRNLVVCGLNVSKGEVVHFSMDSHPSMSVLLAIDISSCIPVVFPPVYYNGDMYLDGGIINILPTDAVQDCPLSILALYTPLDPAPAPEQSSPPPTSTMLGLCTQMFRAVLMYKLLSNISMFQHTVRMRPRIEATVSDLLSDDRFHKAMSESAIRENDAEGYALLKQYIESAFPPVEQEQPGKSMQTVPLSAPNQSNDGNGC
ncbi:hypothetical protein HXX76_014055 [Chlamydomonas incerta]|uniref:Patatin n=1 Tax=Chlamydomonas incerta TaxID=51695 RepID=A0A835SCS1_CHLIN|nr:hypothetical protein HXX76_014055 [Chlamydomonas incerta]|eukprot:KAG2424897.1 hypothetical protein HXX76_014055 [Chlamydomonas incerta]